MGSIKQSGLESVDVKSKCKALRIPWAARIIQGKGWNDIVLEYLEPMGGPEFLIRCNYDIKCMRWMPSFYRYLFEYLKDIIYDYDCMYIIRNNKYTTIEGKSIFWEKWFKSGIIYVRDLMNENCTLMTFEHFSNRIRIRTNFLTYP